MGNSKSVIFLTLFAMFYLTSTASSKSIFSINQDPEAEKVVHGTDVDISSCPYTAVIQSYTRQCNGAIIGPYTVLTAAHCLTNFETPVVYTGITHIYYKNQGARSVKFIDFIRGWDSSSINYENDVAVITLHEKIEFNQYQLAIPLINRPVGPNEVGKLSSWGITEDGRVSDQLKMGNFRISPNSRTGYTDKFYALGVNNVAPCQGDSGGPFVVDGLLVGIQSVIYGQPSGIWSLYYDKCSSTYTAGFTDIYYHASEIIGIMNARLL